MRSFRKSISDRRKAFLALASQVEGGLRAAYDRRYSEGNENQVTLAAKLGVSRSAVNKRLSGRINMTMETIAETAWALGYEVALQIFDPKDRQKNKDYLNYQPTLTVQVSPPLPSQPGITTSPATASSNRILEAA